MATVRYLCPVCRRRNERRGIEQDGPMFQTCPNCRNGLEVVVEMVERSTWDAKVVKVTVVDKVENFKDR